MNPIILKITNFIIIIMRSYYHHVSTDDESSGHYAVIFLVSEAKNVFETYDMMDMVMIKFTSKLSNFVCNLTGNKITSIETIDKFTPIEKTEVWFQQKLLIDLGIYLLSDKSVANYDIFTSWFSYLHNKGVLSLQMYVEMCMHPKLGVQFRANEDLINPVLRFFNRQIPLDPNDKPALDYYLLDSIYKLSINPELRVKMNLDNVMRNIGRSMHVRKCIEVALIACLTDLLPVELYPIILFYMTNVDYVIDYKLNLQKWIIKVNDF